ncbi:hypothetical protein [Caudoviricetes sp.]|nr:hypothetical protein [Caudoviricetes sp.]
MTITPTGSPAWTRQTSHTDYGGHPNKANYMGLGVVSALTDIGAEDFVRMCADLAALARVAPMWVITYICNDTSPAPPTIEVVDGMTGVTVVSYDGDDPPDWFPPAARNGNGDVTFTFDASYLDEYGVSGAWAPTTADGGLHGSTGGSAPAVISGSTVRVRAINHTGAAISDARVTLEVG